MTRRLGTSGQDLKVSKCKLGFSSNVHIPKTNIEHKFQHFYGCHIFGGFKYMKVVLVLVLGYVLVLGMSTLDYLLLRVFHVYDIVPLFNVFLRYMIPHTNDLNVSKRVVDVETRQLHR